MKSNKSVTNTTPTPLTFSSAITESDEAHAAAKTFELIQKEKRIKQQNTQSFSQNTVVERQLVSDEEIAQRLAMAKRQSSISAKEMKLYAANENVNIAEVKLKEASDKSFDLLKNKWR